MSGHRCWSTGLPVCSECGSTMFLSGWDDPKHVTERSELFRTLGLKPSGVAYCNPNDLQALEQRVPEYSWAADAHIRQGYGYDDRGNVIARVTSGATGQEDG